MAGGDADPWSSVAAEWADLWGAVADPARLALIGAAGIGSGSHVLDVGCGSGEFVALLDSTGAVAAGVDPSQAMLDLAVDTAPAAAFRLGSIEHLPWAAGTFDVVVAINSLQFAADADDALVEMARVLLPGGRIGLAQWARGGHDIAALEAAIAAFDGDQPLDDELASEDDELESLLTDAGLDLVDAGLAPGVVEIADADTLLRMLLLGEGPDRREEVRDAVLDAASPFLGADGTYRLRTAMHWAVAALGSGH